MPSFDLRGIKIGKYKNNAGVVSYEKPISIGDAMNCNLQLKFAEGRLYAEGTLAEFMKLATGGTISIGTKYIPVPAQKLMYGAKEKNRTIGGKQAQGIVYTGNDIPDYVGVSFYAPDRIDGETKYTCVFAYKSLFGPPGMQYQTKGENITFQTPTTTGEFLASDGEEKELLEVAVCDTQEEAEQWTLAVMSGVAAADGTATEGEG